jgi:hypothetical protein
VAVLVCPASCLHGRCFSSSPKLRQKPAASRAESLPSDLPGRHPRFELSEPCLGVLAAQAVTRNRATALCEALRSGGGGTEGFEGPAVRGVMMRMPLLTRSARIRVNLAIGKALPLPGRPGLGFRPTRRGGLDGKAGDLPPAPRVLSPWNPSAIFIRAASGPPGH